MGRWAWLGAAAVWAALLPPQASAETRLEPIARLGLEGGYDSNVLYDGRSDTKSAVSPELGLKLVNHRWAFNAAYGADYLQYRRLEPSGVWNHRGALDFDGALTERFSARGSLRATYATDPVGLAQAGIFRTGQDRALVLRAAARAEYAAARRLLVSGQFLERMVRFPDQTGGAMHGPSVDVLRALDERFFVGGAVSYTVFQDFQPGDTMLSYSTGIRARGRYRVTRSVEADAFAGPAFWSDKTGKAVVPEAGVELRFAERAWDLRLSVAHQLGLGSTAAPGLVDSVEVGTVRRFGRTFDLRGDGGIWRSGDAPTGRNATIGFALSGEGGWHVTRQIRLALAAAYLSRLDDSSPLLRRTTVGIRMGWELPGR